jgi:hypothetical protein
VPNNDHKRVKIVEIKDLKQTIENETGYCDMNVWTESVKFWVQALTKRNCYVLAAELSQAQVVPFPL